VADDGVTYEQLVQKLETLTARMASGDIGIEEAADVYEEAGKLHAEATERLARVQERIDKLRGPAAGD
jgi:exodeoxyribonuclease VII small subunit